MTNPYASMPTRSGRDRFPWIPPTEPRPRTDRRGTALGLLLCLSLSFCLACGPKPLGPPFRPAPLPPENRARLYIYRMDERSSLASVRVSVDGREIGRFRDREYETLELPAGRHHVRAGMRGFGMLAWGWNEYRIRMAPGETAYLMLSVRLEAQSPTPAPTAREMEIAGLEGGTTASENVFFVPRSTGEALSDLSATTRLPGAESEGE